MTCVLHRPILKFNDDLQLLLLTVMNYQTQNKGILSQGFASHSVVIGFHLTTLKCIVLGSVQCSVITGFFDAISAVTRLVRVPPCV